MRIEPYIQLEIDYDEDLIQELKQLGANALAKRTGLSPGHVSNFLNCKIAFELSKVNQLLFHINKRLTLENDPIMKFTDV